MLLIVNGLAFLHGSILKVVTEWAVYVWLGSERPRPALIDALFVTAYSTILIGLGFPIVLAIVGGVGMLAPSPVGDFFSALGTWVYEGNRYPEMTYGFTVM